jgi:hypothetical protein
MVYKKFAIGFLIAFFSVLVLLSAAYVGVAKRNFGSSVLTGIWAAIIVLVVLFGVIAISLFVRSLRVRRRKNVVNSLR